MDAKYKAYQTSTVSSSDVHQLLTYIAGHSPQASPTAAIVFAHPQHHSHRVLRVDTSGRHLGEIHVLGVHAATEPADAAAWLSSVFWCRVADPKTHDR